MQTADPVHSPVYRFLTGVIFSCAIAGCGQQQAKPEAKALDLNAACDRITEFAEAEAKAGTLPPGLAAGKTDNCKQVMKQIKDKSASSFKTQSQCLAKAKDYVTAQSCVEQAMMVLNK